MGRRGKNWTRRGVVAGVVGLVLLAGCGGGDDESTDAADTPAPTAEQTPAATPTTELTPSGEQTPSGEPTPADGAGVQEFPDAGLTIVVPETKNDVEAAALATFVEFAREWRKSLREVKYSERLDFLAVPAVNEDTHDSLEYQRDHGIRYSGHMTITPVVERSGEQVVVLGGCLDGSKLTLTQNGKVRPVDGAAEHPVIPIRVVVANSGGWMVNENTVYEGQDCPTAAR
jgi:hypothetical protein